MRPISITSIILRQIKLIRKKMLVLGIDVGTQGTKTILCDGQNGKVVASAREEYPLIEKADGTREQDPASWIKAVTNTIRSVLRGLKRSLRH